MVAWHSTISPESFLTYRHPEPSGENDGLRSRGPLETIAFTVGQGESFEYKYRLDKGEALLYSWSATGRVNYELHAEPDGAPRGYAESYEKRNATDTASGTLTTPFAGIHGWYWENRGSTEVTVILSAAGFYNMSYEFRKEAAPKIKMFQ